MLAIGRGLMSRPKLMLLDEPSLGLAPLVVRELYELIQEILKQGVTILLAEQKCNNGDTSFRLCISIRNGQCEIRRNSQRS